MRIGQDDIAALDLGVTLLGSGGGGDTTWAVLTLRRRLGEITVTPIAELPPETWVVPIGLVGATAVMAEKLPHGGEFEAAVRTIERWTGVRAGALVSGEIGGMNGLMPLVAADDLGVPCVDADLCGRAVPRLDQMSLVASGRGLAPIALAAPNGQVVVLDGGSPSDVERTARGVMPTVGGWAVMALPPVLASDLPECAILGSVTNALELGRKALAAADEHALARATGGRVLAAGRVIEVDRRQGPGFGHGSVTVLDQATDSLLRLEMENEYLLALLDGRPVASTPDVLAVLDRRTRVPISCYDIRPNVEVAVVQLPGADFWRNARRLPTVSPRAFGLDCDPVLL